jgi:hypothetical protein
MSNSLKIIIDFIALGVFMLFTFLINGSQKVKVS